MVFLGARGHAACALGYWVRFWGVLCGLVTVRDGRVLGDLSGAGAGAALGLRFLQGKCCKSSRVDLSRPG